MTGRFILVRQLPDLRRSQSTKCEGVAGPHTFNLGSRSRKVPFPESCASKRNERWFPLAKVISTFHLPIRFGDCASAWAVQPMCAIAIRINAGVALTFSPKPNLLSAQGESVFRTLNCPTTNGHEWT